MKKMFFVLIALVVMFGMVGTVFADGSVGWEGHGDGNLPCDGAHWVLTGVNGATSATLYVGSNSYAMSQSGNNGSWSADSSGVITSGVNASASWTGDVTGGSLQLSHCLGTPPQPTDVPPTEVPSDKIWICHVPEGNTENPQAIEISKNAWDNGSEGGHKTGAHGGDFGPLTGPNDPSCAAPTPPPVLGCTDPAAQNYNPAANVDDGSCTYPPGQPTPTPKPHVNPTPENTPGDSGPMPLGWFIFGFAVILTGALGFTAFAFKKQ